MLSQVIEEYLLWMIDRGYYRKVFKQTEHILSCFSGFIEKYQIQRENIFTHTTLAAFEKEYKDKRNAGSFVRGLWQYLYKQGKIIEPLVKKAPIPEIYEDYLSYYSHRAKADKVQRARKLLSAFNDYLGQDVKSLSSLKITDIDSFLALYTISFNPAVRRNERSYLQGFLRYLYFELKILKRDLASLLKSPPIYTQARPPKFLRSDELERLFKNLKPEKDAEIRAYAMFHLAYSLGLRPCEISLINLDDISFKDRQIKIRDRKNTVPIILPLSDDTIKALAAYIIAVRPKSKERRLFLGLIAPYNPLCSAVVSRAVSRLVRYANPSASAYWLRHTFAQNLLEAGASIFEVKEMLGHESINTTEKYLRINIKLMREVLFDE